MNGISSYWLIIFACCVIIISYSFDILSKRTSIPSVLMLIFTGIGISEIFSRYGLQEINWLPALEILGTLGLIMIILEAALDLKLSRDKLPLILKSFAVALLLLVLSASFIAFIIQWFLQVSFPIALIHSIPLSIMSSAIIIPSISNLEQEKKEFMIYEATFSDILGIIFFYALLDAMEAPRVVGSIFATAGEIGLTVIIAVIVTYFIVFVFQRVLDHVNYFLIFAVLMLLYVVGKLFHLSSLILILVFGLIVNNRDLFFRGFFTNIIKSATYEGILDNFKLFTQQTAFLVRTFFFIVFGMSLTFASFLNYDVYLMTAMIVLALFGLRYLSLTLFFHDNVLFPKLFIAPRGLITILLYFSIPASYLIGSTEEDLIFLVIMATNFIMMAALMLKTGKADVAHYNENI